MEPDSRDQFIFGEVAHEKCVAREVCQGSRSLEDIFASVILRDTTLTAGAESDIIESTEQPQDSLCSVKGANDGTSDE